MIQKTPINPDATSFCNKKGCKLSSLTQRLLPGQQNLQCRECNHTYQCQTWVVRIHLQRFMYWVHHNVETPHQSSGGSSNLNSQHYSSIPHVTSKIQCLSNTYVQVEAKCTKVDEGDYAAMKTELPASSELAGCHGTCKVINQSRNLAVTNCMLIATCCHSQQIISCCYNQLSS